MTKNEKIVESGNNPTLQELLLNLSTGFINIAGTNLDERINDALGEIGAFCKVDRVSIFLLALNKLTISSKYEWCAPGLSFQSSFLQNIELSARPWLQKQLGQQIVVAINDLAELPADALIEKDELASQGVQSLLIVPMIYNYEPIGFLQFDAVKSKRQWTANEITLLKIAADIFTLSLIRQKTEDSLHQSERMYRLLLDTVNAGIVISQNDRFLFVNPKFAQMLGYQVNEIIGMDYRQIFSQQGVTLLLERQRRRQMGKSVPPHYQTTFKTKNGQFLDVEVNTVITEYNGAPATFAIVRDITEEKEQAKIRQNLEVKLLKQQRLMSLNILASALVHNIKELLTVIMGRAQLLKGKYPELKEPDIISANSRKIEKILNNFVQKINLEQATEPVRINFNDLLKTELMFLEADSFYKNQVEKDFHFDPSIPPYRGFYSDFAHGLITIIQFALDSLRTAAVKKLRITTRADAREITLTIGATGQTFSREELQSLFMPQIMYRAEEATRQSEKVLLAKYKLYNAYLILSNYQVKINVGSQPEAGMIFEIIIPLLADRE